MGTSRIPFRNNAPFSLDYHRVSANSNSPSYSTFYLNFLVNIAMAEDDWGAADAFDGGDYPVLGDVAAPSAPGKRAKRTFNKQHHTLDAMAAGTVTLDRPKGGPPPPFERSSGVSSHEMVDAHMITFITKLGNQLTNRRVNELASCLYSASQARST